MGTPGHVILHLGPHEGERGRDDRTIRPRLRWRRRVVYRIVHREAGQLDIGYTFLGVLLAGITIIPAIQIASLPPITIMWLRLWCPALGFALNATAATTYSLAIQAHRAAWVAAVLALVVAALVLLQIIIACRKKAKEIAENFNERLRDVLRYDHY